MRDGRISCTCSCWSLYPWWNRFNDSFLENRRPLVQGYRIFFNFVYVYVLRWATVFHHHNKKQSSILGQASGLPNYQRASLRKIGKLFDDQRMNKGTNQTKTNLRKLSILRLRKILDFTFLLLVKKSKVDKIILCKKIESFSEFHPYITAKQTPGENGEKDGTNFVLFVRAQAAQAPTLHPCCFTLSISIGVCCAVVCSCFAFALLPLRLASS